MKRTALLGAALAGFALAACAPQDPAAFAERQWRTCQATLYPAERVLACTNVIGSPAPIERRVEALVVRGGIFAERGQHIRAIADYGRALRLDPASVEARFARAEAHHERGSFEDAVTDYDAVLAAAPEHANAALRREDAIAGRIEGFERQLAEINRMIALRPRDAELLNSRCWLRGTAGRDLELALDDCDAALRANPRYAPALDSRALVYFKRGEFALAIRDYDAALVIEPEEPHYLFGRGVSRISAGQIDEGRADIVDAEALDPGITETYQSYGVNVPTAASADAPVAAKPLSP